MIINKTWNEADYIAETLGDRSLRAGAEFLNEKLPQRYAITHSTLDNWLKGVHCMNDDFMQALLLAYPSTDARFELGFTIRKLRLAAMRRELNMRYREIKK